MKTLHPGLAILPHEASLVHDGAALLETNPFGEKRVEIERRILGDRYEGGGRVIGLVGSPAAPVMGRIRPVVEAVCQRLRAGASATAEEIGVYVKVSFLVLYDSFDVELQHVIDTGVLRPGVYGRFVEMHALFFVVAGLRLDVPGPGVLFALLYQVKRVYFVLHTTLRGVSIPTARLRASVWNAIFAGDLLRYMRWKYAHMDGATTLILGDTGTGKVVAKALAFARYLPFDEARGAFAAGAGEGFHAVNISGLAVALADSLLFGHKKGAFTGALEDAPGALALCVRGSFLFLDEVGDLDPSIQVKLLRVLEEAKYRPVGTNREQEILGSLIFATQPARFRGPTMRRDLRYRIHKNVIRTPSLRARLDDDPEELPFLVRLFAEEEAGPDADALTAETLAVIHADYRDHDWPGNVRELKACVENVASQHEYTPPGSLAPQSLRAPRSLRGREPPANDLTVEGPGTELARAVLRAEISCDDLRERYILHSVAQTGSYTDTALRLGIDRRTVRAVVEAAGSSPPDGRAGQRRRGGRG